MLFAETLSACLPTAIFGVRAGPPRPHPQPDLSLSLWQLSQAPGLWSVSQLPFPKAQIMKPLRTQPPRATQTQPPRIPHYEAVF